MVGARFACAVARLPARFSAHAEARQCGAEIQDHRGYIVSRLNSQPVPQRYAVYSCFSHSIACRYCGNFFSACLNSLVWTDRRWERYSTGYRRCSIS